MMVAITKSIKYNPPSSLGEYDHHQVLPLIYIILHSQNAHGSLNNLIMIFSIFHIVLMENMIAGAGIH